jgi:hypothetical protein
MEMVLTMGIYFTYNTQRGARAKTSSEMLRTWEKPQSQNNSKLHNTKMQITNQNFKTEM